MATLAEPVGLAVADGTPSSATDCEIDVTSHSSSAPEAGISDTSKHKSMSRSSSQSSSSHEVDIHVGSNRFQDNHCYPLEYSEDTPLFNHANGRITSSQEDSECEGHLTPGDQAGAERVIAGETETLDRECSSSSLKAYSSASGDGSSIWSGDDVREQNEQGSPQYGLLNNGSDSELSSPGETPDPVATIELGTPSSLVDNGTPSDTTGIQPSISNVVEDKEAAVPDPEDTFSGPVALPEPSPSSLHELSTTTCKKEDPRIEDVPVDDIHVASSDCATINVDKEDVKQDPEEGERTRGREDNEQETLEVSKYAEQVLSEGGEGVELESSEPTLPEVSITNIPLETTEDGERELIGNKEEVVTELPVNDVPLEDMEREGREMAEQESVDERPEVSKEEQGRELSQEAAAVTSSGDVLSADVECEGRERTEQEVASKNSSVDDTPAADRERESFQEIAATPTSGDLNLTDAEGEGRMVTEEGSAVAINDTTTNSSSSPAVLIHTSSMVEATLPPEQQGAVGNLEVRQSSSTVEDDIDNPLAESDLDFSNLDSGIRRPPPSDPDCSNLDSGIRRPASSNLPVLKPLSPDPNLNEQYEYLRRTLSHSRRRYSTRRRRPHRRAARNEDDQTSESEVRSEQQQHTMRDMLQGQQREQGTCTCNTFII